MTDDLDRRREFIIEAKDLLDQVENYLLELEGSAQVDLSIVNEIFRHIHTIKGGSDFLGLSMVKQLSHASEDVLDLVRKGTINLSSNGINTFLVVCDTMKELLDNEDDADSIDISHLLADIGAIPDDEGELESQYIDAASELLEIGTPRHSNLFQLSVKQYADLKRDQFSLYVIEIVDGEESSIVEKTEALLREIVSIGYILNSEIVSNDDPDDGDDDKKLFVLFRSVLVKTSILNFLELSANTLYEYRMPSLPDSAKAVLADDEAGGAEEKIPDRREERRTDRRRNYKDRRSGSGDRREMSGVMDKEVAGGQQSIRVNVEILDSLMNLVGELVLTRNQLKQVVESSDYTDIPLTAQRLDIVTSELQDSIMATRMQPLGFVLSKFHRIIRDLSNHLGKSVELVLEGEDVELDKSIIENISDPLTHLVRNAIDHGIESPDVRNREGKPVKATLAIKARQEGGHVVIEIIDDGRGIDKEKVRETAVSNGLIDQDKVNDISDKELTKMIFAPGFSTAEVVSDISGRGVGLDVVFTNISKLGGAIDIETELGKGTTFKVSLPLTLAIVPSLLVSCMGGTYAIPQIALMELVRIPVDQVQDRIKFLGDAAVMRLRDSLLPIVWLADVIGLERGSNWSEDTINIAVVYSGEFLYGIVVDQFTDSEEIVVKPLSRHLRSCRAYASATILGDGRAALIVDVNGIAEKVSVPAQSEIESEAADGVDEAILKKVENAIGNDSSMLIVEGGEDETYAIELAYVNRIERLDGSHIQSMKGKHVIKYRDTVLRLFRINESMNVDDYIRDDRVYLIVFYLMGNEVAVLVSNIIDIVDSFSDTEASTIQGDGIIGTTIIDDRITMIVDLFELVKGQGNDLFEHVTKMRALPDSASKEPTVLVVEDSIFFQDKLKALLMDMGITVLLAEDGQEGYEMLEQNKQVIDLVLTDVEMPRMSGIELCRTIRDRNEYQDLPIIMLTSLAKQTDIDIGLNAGATEYLIKMDQEMVRKVINDHITKRSMVRA